MGKITQIKNARRTAGSLKPHGSACTYPTPGDVETSVCGAYWAKCSKCGKEIVRVMGFRRWRHIKKPNTGSHRPSEPEANEGSVG